LHVERAHRGWYCEINIRCSNGYENGAEKGKRDRKVARTEETVGAVDQENKSGAAQGVLRENGALTRER